MFHFLRGARSGGWILVTRNWNQVCVCVCVCSVTSVVSDSFEKPWTVARQAPLSMGFSGQEYWSGLPFPPPEDLPNQEIKTESPVPPALQVILYPLRFMCNYLICSFLVKPWQVSKYHTIGHMNLIIWKGYFNKPKLENHFLSTHGSFFVFFYSHSLNDHLSFWQNKVLFMCNVCACSLLLLHFISVTRLCFTLFDHVNCSLPGLSVHGVFQVRIQELVAIFYSRGSSQPRDQTQASCVYHIGRWIP